MGSDADELDLYNHLAYGAFHDRQKLDEALDLVDRELSRHPSSTTALILRGEILAAQRACQGAAANWERVASAPETGVECRKQKSRRACRRRATGDFSEMAKEGEGTKVQMICDL